MASAPPTADQLIHSCDCIALAPLLYVAWADGELEADEIAAVQKVAEKLSLAEPQATALASWLDPAAAPSSTELLRLARFIRAELGHLDAATRGSLVDMGLAMAKRRFPESTVASLRALHEVEEALGLTGSEVARELFAERPPVAHHFQEEAPVFSPDALTTLLDGDYREDWLAVREVLTRAELREPPKHEHDAYREQVLGWLRVLADAGMGGVGYPESCGGHARLDRFLEVFEALGMGDLSLVIKFGVQFGLFGGAILNLGSEEHHAKYLEAAGRAQLLGGFAMTELGHGSNVRDIETIARYQPDKDVFVVHSPSPSARKEWIGNAAVHGTMMAVFAQLEVARPNGEIERHGVHAFMVPVRDDEGRPLPGVTIGDCGPKMGLNGVDNGQLLFDHVEVPRTALLNRYGHVTESGDYESSIASESRRFFTMLGTLVGGRIGVAATSVSASKTALAIAVRYGALRRQFGPAGKPERRILDFPTHGRRLFPRIAGTYALHFAMRELKEQFRDHEGDDRRELESFAAGLKAVATWHAIDTAQACRECCGGMGFSSANRIAEIRKDVDVFATFEGDNTVLLQLVAKGLLTGYAKAFSHDLLGTLLRRVRTRANVELLERNPFAARYTSEEHLADAKFHQEALAFRKSDLLQSAASRMKRRIDDGMDGFEALLEVQSHLVSLALAHVEETIHAAFVRAVSRVTGAERDILEKVRCLYALWRLDDDMAWFLENGYVEPVKARAVRKLFEERCQALRPHALGLVDAFAIPDAVLPAIAVDGYIEQLA